MYNLLVSKSNYGVVVTRSFVFENADKAIEVQSALNDKGYSTKLNKVQLSDCFDADEILESVAKSMKIEDRDPISNIFRGI